MHRLGDGNTFSEFKLSCDVTMVHKIIRINNDILMITVYLNMKDFPRLCGRGFSCIPD